MATTLATLRVGDTLIVAINYAGPNASGLGHLLHKHPGKLRSFETRDGTAQVFHPEANQGSCTAVMSVEVDSIAWPETGT